MSRLRVRWRSLCVAGESGQALIEQGLLLASLFGILGVGGLWLMKTHPDLLRAIDVHVRGFYFTLSLPFP